MDTLQLHTEPLNVDEFSFLKKREQKERRQYFKVFRLLMFLSFIIPFAGAWYRAFDGAPNAFSLFHFFITASLLLSISAGGTWLSYWYNLHKLQKDIKYATKTIEMVHVMRKQYMPQNNTYYFYLDSPNVMSIEVSQLDFHRLIEGDELSVEFSTNAGIYLGYF